MEQLKVLFPFMEWDTPSIRANLRKETITIGDLSAQNLLAAGLSPPLEQVVAIVEFNFDNNLSEKSQPASHTDSSEAYSSTSTPLSALPRYFQQLMSHSRYRDWASGAFIAGDQMSLVSHDREGAVQSASISLRSPEGFKLFSRWVFSVGSRTLEQWGFSRDFGLPGNQINGLSFKVPEHAKSGCDDTIHLKFGEQHHNPSCLFGPGTLYNVDVITGTGTTKGVCKISWPVVHQDGVHCLLQRAQIVDPLHVSEIICAWYVDKEDLPSRKLRSHCGPTVVNWQKRLLRILVLPIYPPIHELEGGEFFTAFWDVMRCTVKLHEVLSYLLQLNFNNMVYSRDKDGLVVGMLSDFDLATRQSGTAPFMALDLLDPDACEQELSHDFESALYILFWVALGYKGWKPPAGDPLSD